MKHRIYSFGNNIKTRLKFNSKNLFFSIINLFLSCFLFLSVDCLSSVSFQDDVSYISSMIVESIQKNDKTNAAFGSLEYTLSYDNNSIDVINHQVYDLMYNYYGAAHNRTFLVNKIEEGYSPASYNEVPLCIIQTLNEKVLFDFDYLGFSLLDGETEYKSNYFYTTQSTAKKLFGNEYISFIGKSIPLNTYLLLDKNEVIADFVFGGVVNDNSAFELMYGDFIFVSQLARETYFGSKEADVLLTNQYYSTWSMVFTMMRYKGFSLLNEHVLDKINFYIHKDGEYDFEHIRTAYKNYVDGANDANAVLPIIFTLICLIGEILFLIYWRRKVAKYGTFCLFSILIGFIIFLGICYSAICFETAKTIVPLLSITGITTSSFIFVFFIIVVFFFKNKENINVNSKKTDIELEGYLTLNI